MQYRVESAVNSSPQILQGMTRIESIQIVMFVETTAGAFFAFIEVVAN